VGVLAAVAVARTGALSTNVTDAWLAVAIAAPLSMAVVLAVALTVSRSGR
jgi:hypothetical protein